MLSRQLPRSPTWNSPSLCLFCASRSQRHPSLFRTFSSSTTFQAKKKTKDAESTGKDEEATADSGKLKTKIRTVKSKGNPNGRTKVRKVIVKTDAQAKAKENAKKDDDKASPGLSLKDALLAAKKNKKNTEELLQIEILSPRDLNFEPVDVPIPPVPMLSYGLDRVLFNPGVYRLQDPRSRIFNFDPYLEKIMPVKEFNFNALREYKTSSKDANLLAITKKTEAKFTGSTSSMSSVLQHFHFLLSNFRPLNHDMLSRKFPNPSPKFSTITLGPDAIFLRWKDGVYAIDADKSYDSPNIMSWLGHSLEKLLTSDRSEFERYRRSSEEVPPEDSSSLCYHYSRLGNILMRSQLDAHDPRLPGSGIFDLKTRAVVSIRMNHTEYETGQGYQLRYDRGEWESYEREFYDMTRATMLKYSLQVRMGRMDGIFVAYHNIERLFGFQYMSLPDMDNVLHGQTDTCLGDQEFKLSISLLQELLERATAQFPNTSLRLHVEARETPYMYVFAEPVTEEQADEIQSSSQDAQREFEREIVGIKRDDSAVQAAWNDIQGRVDEKIDEDEMKTPVEETNEEEPADQSLADAETDLKVGPIMGWTLTTRNQVNGRYVTRPEKLEPEDEWSVEYHIQEIAPEARWTLYHKLKERRRKLIGLDIQETLRGRQFYIDMIKKYSDKGREWRETQDKVDQEIGQKIYTRLGPGSQAASAVDTSIKE